MLPFKKIILYDNGLVFWRFECKAVFKLVPCVREKSQYFVGVFSGLGTFKMNGHLKTDLVPNIIEFYRFYDRLILRQIYGKAKDIIVFRWLPKSVTI